MTVGRIELPSRRLRLVGRPVPCPQPRRSLIDLLDDDEPVAPEVCREDGRPWWGDERRPIAPGQEAARALVRIGIASFDPLSKALTGAGPIARRHAAWALGALDDIQRVEVLRGPASSTLYGSGALGGVVNAITPQETFRQSPFSGLLGSVTVDGSGIVRLSVDERGKAGVFLAKQYPVGVPGVSVSSFLRTAKTAIERRLEALKLEHGQAIEGVSGEVERVLSEAGVKARVFGRQKTPYSIWPSPIL